MIYREQVIKIRESGFGIPLIKIIRQGKTSWFFTADQIALGIIFE